MRTTLKSKRLLLRAPTLKDAPNIVRYAGKMDIARYTMMPHPYLKKHALEFIEKTAKERKEKKTYAFAITINNELIGMMSFHKVDAHNKNAEVGYWVAKPYWGRGIASEALGLLVDFGFKDLKLEKLYARVLAPNAASLHVLEKAGFVQEGLHRRHVFRNKMWYDEYFVGLLRKDLRKK